MELRFGGEGCAVREKRNMIKLRKIIQKKINGKRIPGIKTLIVAMIIC